MGGQQLLRSIADSVGVDSGSATQRTGLNAATQHRRVWATTIQPPEAMYGDLNAVDAFVAE